MSSVLMFGLVRTRAAPFVGPSSSLGCVPMSNQRVFVAPSSSLGCVPMSNQREVRRLLARVDKCGRRREDFIISQQTRIYIHTRICVYIYVQFSRKNFICICSFLHYFLIFYPLNSFNSFCFFRYLVVNVIFLFKNITETIIYFKN